MKSNSYFSYNQLPFHQ